MAVLKIRYLSTLLLFLTVCPGGYSEVASQKVANGLNNGAGKEKPNLKTVPKVRNVETKEGKGPYTPDWDSLDTRPIPLWYDEAKFGIFMHWGVYSVPGVESEWFWTYWINNKNSSAAKYVEANYPARFTYPEFAPQFKAEFFNATKFAETIKKSGAKYFVLTSKHHEGYTMYPSNYSWNWNSVDVGPGRDIVGELRTAINDVGGVRFGLYFSQFEWFNRLYLDDKTKTFTTFSYPKMVSLPQLYEIINTYKPNVLWSDGDWEAPAGYWNSTHFLAWLYNESPVKDYIVTNDRWGAGIACHHGDFYTCTDRFNPGKLQAHKWENCMTVDRQSWGFRRTMTYDDVMSFRDLLTTLVETISCGGNLLMNVGPTSWGMIAPIFEERMAQMGEWLGRNGEAVYGTKPWIHQNDSITGTVWYTSRLRDPSAVDPRRAYNPQSQNNTIVYAFMLHWPSDGYLRLAAIPTNSSKVTLIGYPEPMKFYPFTHGIKVDLRSLQWTELPSLVAWVFKIEYLNDSSFDPTKELRVIKEKHVQDERLKKNVDRV